MGMLLFIYEDSAIMLYTRIITVSFVDNCSKVNFKHIYQSPMVNSGLNIIFNSTNLKLKLEPHWGNN